MRIIRGVGWCISRPIHSVGVGLGGGEALEAVCGREDRDSLIAAERLQVIVARDDEIGAGGERAGEDRCVIGIAKPRLFDRSGFDGFGDLPVARDDLGGAEVLLAELLSELGAAEDAGELGEERFGGEEFEAAFARELDQPLRGATPKQGGCDDVGVKDDAQGLREARRARPSARTRARLR